MARLYGVFPADGGALLKAGNKLPHSKSAKQVHKPGLSRLMSVF